MSHYSEILTKFKETDCLIKALQEVFAEQWAEIVKRSAAKGISGSDPRVEVHENPMPLYGFQGDFRMASDWGAHTKDPNLAVKAHVIVRREFLRGSANDLGFERTADGTYRMIVSDYDKSQGNNETWLQKVTQRYNIALDRKKARIMGYQVTEKPMPDGSVKLTLRR
jgi:hypothetical protein